MPLFCVRSALVRPYGRPYDGPSDGCITLAIIFFPTKQCNNRLSILHFTAFLLMKEQRTSLFKKGIAANRGIPSGKVDRQWEDSNPRPVATQNKFWFPVQSDDKNRKGTKVHLDVPTRIIDVKTARVPRIHIWRFLYAATEYHVLSASDVFHSMLGQRRLCKWWMGMVNPASNVRLWTTNSRNWINMGVENCDANS